MVLAGDDRVGTLFPYPVILSPSSRPPPPSYPWPINRSFLLTSDATSARTRHDPGWRVQVNRGQVRPPEPVCTATSSAEQGQFHPASQSVRKLNLD